MNHYELLFILPGTLTESEVVPLVDKIKEVVTELEGTNVTVRDLGKNRLAYPIRHIRYGYFHLCRFEAEADKIKAIRNKIGLMSEPLRALIQSFDPEKQKEIKLEHFTTAEKAQAPRPEEQPRKRGDVSLNTVPVTKKPKEVKEVVPKKKVSLEEIDKQLDEILGGDMSEV
ncbi:30S ribosomal protein S6 [Patescibacteria group bacterium]|nr:30S ribosomal protein S6 [Patescibacteria group bacterium]MBU1895340.1 30S ribosomal protein S6 [Patescibacteria group bacterium]